MNRHMFLLLQAVACPVCGFPSSDDPAPEPLPMPVGSGPAVRPPEIDLDYKASQVIRRGPDGRIQWATPVIGELISSRDPDLLHDADRVYVPNGDGITALAKETGKVLCYSEGPNDCLFLDGDTLLAADSGGGAHIDARGRLLVARVVATGAEKFRVPLPLKNFDPWSIQEVAGLFLLQDDKRALLVDRMGQVRHRFARFVVDGTLSGEDRVFLTNKNVVRVSPDDVVAWTIPLEDEVARGGGLMGLTGGDLLAFHYCVMSDSGVEVVRFDPRTGKVVWQANCAELGVGHSKYRHEVAVAIEGDRVQVVSQGSYGTFIETLDLKTGRQLWRR